MFSLQSGGLCELAAIADPFASRFDEAVAALRAENIGIYEDVAKMLQNADIDACIIATPIPLHVPQTLAALDAGKHVYLEKPPCVTLEELEQLRSAQEASGKVCAVGFQMQTTPAMRFINGQIASGAIGKLQTVSAGVRWMRNDGYYGRSGWAGKWMHNGQPVFDGPATNALAHVAHASLFLSGASSHEWGSIARVRGCLKKARPIESYDSIFLEAETETGVLVRLCFTHATNKGDEVRIRCIGDAGEAEIEWNGTVRLTQNGEETRQFNFFCESHYASMLNFLRSLREPSQTPKTTFEDCRPYLQLTNGALQSSGGASDFQHDKIRFVGAGDSGAYYTVAGLDEQIESFVEDPQAIPPLLAPGEWIEADQIRTHLAVDSPVTHS
jgi:predicted dehydrogenase